MGEKTTGVFTRARAFWLATCLWAFIASATSATDNLLVNGAYASRDGALTGWDVNAAKFERLEVPTFQGHPWNMPYLRWENEGGTLSQKLVVKPDTWYVMTAWVRSQKGMTPGSTNFWMNLWYPGGDGCLARNNYFMLGSADEWTQARNFWQSGPRKEAVFRIAIMGPGRFDLGACEVREMTDADMGGDAVYDGTFEFGATGRQPVSFRAHAGKYFMPKVVETPEGGRAMELVAGVDSGVYVYGPGPMALKSGWKIKVGCRVKSSADGVGFCLGLTGGPAVQKFYKNIALTAKWQWFNAEFALAPQAGNKDTVTPVCCYLKTLGPVPAGTRIWVDDFTFKGLPPPSVDNPGFINRSFEAGFTGWQAIYHGAAVNGQYTGEACAFAIDSSTATEGRHSARLTNSGQVADTKFPTEIRLMGACFPVTEGKDVMVTFDAKSDTPGYPLRVSVYESSYIGPSATVGLTSEWKRYALRIPIKKSFNGYSFLVFTAAGRRGTVWIDAVEVADGKVPGAPPEPFPKLELGVGDSDALNFYFPGDTPRSELFVCSRLSKETPAKLTRIVWDWLDRPIDVKTETLTLKPGESLRRDDAYPGDRTGYFRVEYVLKADGGTLTADTLYAVLPRPIEIDPEKSAFGIHIRVMFGGGYHCPGNANLEDIAALVAKMGVHWDRSFGMGFWNACEPEKDQWNYFDPYVDAVRKAGIKIMPVLGPFASGPRVPKWAVGDEDSKYPLTKETLYYCRTDAWKNFVSGFMKHYYPRIDAFEVLNEAGQASPKKYAELARAALEARNEAEPKARLVGPTYPCQGIPYGPEDKSWIGEVLKLGVYNIIDVFSAHLYGGREEVETVVDEYGPTAKSLKRRFDYLKSAYGNKPIWDTEWGLSGKGIRQWLYHPLRNDMVLSAAEQAALTVRWLVMKRAEGVDKFFWHPLREPAAKIDGHDLLEQDWKPRPVAVAYATMANVFDGATFVRKIAMSSTAWAFVFERDKLPVAVVWDYRAEGDAGKLRLAAATPDVFSATDIMGAPVQGAFRDGKVVYPLNGNPLYIRANGLSAAKLTAAFDKAEVLTVHCAFRPYLSGGDGRTRLGVACDNRGTETVTAEIALDKVPSDWALPARKATIAEIAARTCRYARFYFDAFPKTGGNISGTARVGERTFAFDRDFLVTTAVAVDTPVSVDGEVHPGEYAPASPLVLDKKDLVRGDALSRENEKAVCRVVWTPERVWIGVSVTDDKLVNNAPDDALFRSDSVEIYLNTAPATEVFFSLPATSLGHTGKLTFSPPGNGKPARFTLTKAKNGRIRGVSIADMTWKMKATPAGYDLEIALPLEKKLTDGTVWGFNFSVIDLDEDRDLFRSQAMWVKDKNAIDDSYSWGNLVFVPQREKAGDPKKKESMRQ